MLVSYNGLWKLLIDKNMKKIDLVNELGISSSTIAKMTRGEYVSMAVLGKICSKLDCDFGDIVHFENVDDSAIQQENVGEYRKDINVGGSYI